MRLSLLLLLAACAAATPAAALTVTVPDDYATIQAALDAGADQVYVADGDYHEVVSATHDVELLPKPPAWSLSPLPMPRVDGLEIHHESGLDRIYVRGFHFTGPVKLYTACDFGEAFFEGCRMDAGITTPAACGLGQALRLRGCLIFGGVDVTLYYPDFAGNTVVDGGIFVRANGGGTVRDNLVLGPADYGISSPTVDGYVVVTGNVVRNTTEGILTQGGRVSDNLVEDCTGTAYRTFGGGFGTPTLERNVARRCGGHGFDIAEFGYVRGNTVEDAGSCGVHGGTDAIFFVAGNDIRGTGSHGIWLEGDAMPLSGNTVLNAGGDGILTSGPAYLNVVGRSAGRGIVAGGAAVGNTSFLNAGAGCEIGHDGNHAGPDSVSHNIAFGNVGHGLVWSGGGTPVVDCNDWFANSAGATSGIPPGPTDLAVDPMFCDVPGDDVHLAAGSPLAGAPGCGPIGALGVGCAAPVGVDPAAPEQALRFEVRPLPARGDMDFTWRPEAGEVRVDVYDVTGALRWSGRGDGSAGRLHWDGRDLHGTPLSPGVYFARGNAAARGGARIVLIR